MKLITGTEYGDNVFFSVTWSVNFSDVLVMPLAIVALSVLLGCYSRYCSPLFSSRGARASAGGDVAGGGIESPVAPERSSTNNKKEDSGDSSEPELFRGESPRGCTWGVDPDSECFENLMTPLFIVIPNGPPSPVSVLTSRPALKRGKELWYVFRLPEEIAFDPQYTSGIYSREALGKVCAGRERALIDMVQKARQEGRLSCIVNYKGLDTAVHHFLYTMNATEVRVFADRDEPEVSWVGMHVTRPSKRR